MEKAKTIKELGLKIGDKVMIADDQLPITENWMGESGRFTHQGPYTIDKMIGNGGVYQLSGIPCGLFRRFMKVRNNNMFKIYI